MEVKAGVDNKKFYIIVAAVVLVGMVVFLFMPKKITLSKTCPDGREIEVSASDVFLLKYLSNSFSIAVKSKAGDAVDFKVDQQINYQIDKTDKRRDFLLRTKMLKILDEAC